MSFSTTAGYPRAICQPVAKITNGDGTNKVTIYTAGADGAHLRALFATSTDTSTRSMILFLNKAGVDYQIAQFSITANAGNGNGPVNLLNHSFSIPYTAYDSDGNKCFQLAANCALKAAMTSNITSGKEVAIGGYGSEF